MGKYEWIFLDMGGTFVDESGAWADRIKRTAEVNDVSADLFRAEMERAAAANLPEYFTAMQKFGIRYAERFDHSLEKLCVGAAEALEKLHGRYSLGVIANQPETARERLREFGVLKYFDHLTLSGEIGFSKPSPTIFRETLRMVGTTADKCVMIGDKLTNDIAPAKKLGFGTVWVKREFGGMNTITDETMRPDHTVRNILQAAELFADL